MGLAVHKLQLALCWVLLDDMQVKPGTDEASAQKMLDDFWSLQYLIPAGVVTAFAGALKLAGATESDSKLTHAVHMRFSSMQVMSRKTCTFDKAMATQNM